MPCTAIPARPRLRTSASPACKRPKTMADRCPFWPCPGDSPPDLSARCALPPTPGPPRAPACPFRPWRGDRPSDMSTSDECLLVGGRRRVGARPPRKVAPDPFARGLAEAPAQRTIAEQPLERRAQRGHVARRDEHARLAVDDEIEQPAYGGGHHRPSVRHRLRAHDAEPLPVRRAGDHGGPPVQRPQPVVRPETPRALN